MSGRIFALPPRQSTDRYTWLSDILQFDSPLVMNAFCNLARMEGAILVVHRRDGDEIMKRNPPRGATRAISLDCYELGGKCVINTRGTVLTVAARAATGCRPCTATRARRD